MTKAFIVMWSLVTVVAVIVAMVLSLVFAIAVAVMAIVVVVGNAVVIAQTKRRDDREDGMEGWSGEGQAVGRHV